MTLPATYILIALWPINGAWAERREAATTYESCVVAAEAAVSGLGLPLDVDGPASAARCAPGNRFSVGWDCIAGAGVPEAAKCR